MSGKVVLMRTAAIVLGLIAGAKIYNTFLAPTVTA